MSAGSALWWIMESIGDFDDQCQLEEYTDTDTAWELLRSIRERCEREIKRMLDASA